MTRRPGGHRYWRRLDGDATENGWVPLYDDGIHDDGGTLDGNFAGTLAACAAALLFAGGGATTMLFHPGENPPPVDPVAQGGGASLGGGEGRVVVMRNGKAVATLTASDRNLTEMLKKLEQMERLRPAPEVIQDIARLKRELKVLRRADSARFTAGPRAA